MNFESSFFLIFFLLIWGVIAWKKEKKDCENAYILLVT